MSYSLDVSSEYAAGASAIGFNFQEYFFLLKLLNLKSGQTVGYECKDDVHTELENDVQVLYQLKHTVQTKDNGDPINLRTLDSDLWKTLSNWTSIICDVELRKTKESQLHFLEKTYFVLASNKSESRNNKLTKIISQHKSGLIDIGEVREEIEAIKLDTSDELIANYMSNFLMLDDYLLSKFIYSISMELEIDNIVDSCKEAIKEKMVGDNDLDLTLNFLCGAINNDKFFVIKNNGHYSLSFDEFRLKYRSLFDRMSSKNLVIEPYQSELKDTVEEQIFIKQLIDVGDVVSTDSELIYEYTKQKLKALSNINRWLNNGEITSIDLDELFSDAKLKWRNTHRSSHRDTKDSDSDKNNALKVLDVMRDYELELLGSNLKTSLSNGYYYHLSDIPEVGWIKKWEVYKK
ncbi:hypothetical protein [Vibrio nigripulchritudo]|uniref:hypothetical protein n=1 Tax=Vibrio nigripulchritudo TaxID=28173 RepID=UPI0024923725|nr:hypothetical protein [Vibrio nigripulchritudo]BDU36698.1 hypothetical protein TUMSATVNIG2_11670 [Vibrio nigripulchritudo]BDU42407.1 hypothetical protein TUMSATVNIG3_12050 [Vibrio nigripulchritudo]